MAAHLTPRPRPEPVEMPSLSEMLAPFPPPDPRTVRLVEAFRALEPHVPADFTDAELEARWGPELARYYFEKIRMPPGS